MSGSITNPSPFSGVVADGYKAYWGGLSPTAIALDIASPSFQGKSWFTGFSTGGWLNYASATMTGSVSGGPFGLAALGVTNFGVDRWGNFCFQMPTPNLETWTITQSGVTSPTWGANVYGGQTWSPVNLTTPSGVNCIFWFDPQDPTCLLLREPGITPSIAGLSNKLNQRQFMSSNGVPLATWGRGGGSGKTRTLICQTNPNLTTPYFAPANWFGALRSASPAGPGNGNQMDNIIAALDSGAGALPSALSIIMAVNKQSGGTTGYGNGCIWQGQLPGGPTKYTQVRWNSSSGTPIDLNLAWGSGGGAIGNATTMSDGQYYFTATISAGGNLVFRVNGTQTGTGTTTADATTILNEFFGLGVNNLPSLSFYPNGVPFTNHGSCLIFSGVLAAGDLTAAESWVARSTL